MAKEYNPMQDPTSAVERAKKKRVGKVRKDAGKTVTTDPDAAPAKKATRVQAPTVVKRDTDVQKAAGIPKKRELPMKEAPRKPGEKPGEGRIRKVTPKKAAPGYYFKGRYMTKPPPKPKSPPKKDLTAGTIGGLKQPTPSQMGVSAETGKPKKTYGERMIGAMERFGAKVAPPGSVTRLRETGARAPRTMGERLGSISRTAQRTFPAEEGTKKGGILNIEELRRQTTGPMGGTQRPRTPPPARELSLEEKQRKGIRVTAADVPGTGKGPTPVGKTLKAGGAPGAAEVTTHRAPGKDDLGSYTVKGYVPPKPKPRVVKKKKGYQPPARAESFREIMGGIFGSKKK